MADSIQLASTPGIDLPCTNKGVTAIPAGRAVRVDPSNLIPDVDAFCVALPPTAGEEGCNGITLSEIPAGGQGLVRIAGLAIATASGTVTVNEHVQAQVTSGNEGKVSTAGSAKDSIGKAWNTATDGNDVIVQIAIARNA